jgi:hypothetical protein
LKNAHFLKYSDLQVLDNTEDTSFMKFQITGLTLHCMYQLLYRTS